MKLNHITTGPYLNKDINNNFSIIEKSVNSNNDALVLNTVAITLLCIPHLYTVYKFCKHEYNKYYDEQKLYNYDN